MVSSPVVLSSLFLKMASGWGYFLLVTKLPSYLSSIFGIDIFKNGAFSASTSLAQGLCALAAAPLSNWIISRFQLNTLTVRKVFQSIAMLGPAVCFSLIPLMGCNSAGAISLLLLGMFAYGAFTGRFCSMLLVSSTKFPSIQVANGALVQSTARIPRAHCLVSQIRSHF